jgi:hypothetical protein
VVAIQFQRGVAIEIEGKVGGLVGTPGRAQEIRDVLQLDHRFEYVSLRARKVEQARNLVSADERDSEELVNRIDRIVVSAALDSVGARPVAQDADGRLGREASSIAQDLERQAVHDLQDAALVRPARRVVRSFVEDRIVERAARSQQRGGERHAQRRAVLSSHGVCDPPEVIAGRCSGR